MLTTRKSAYELPEDAWVVRGGEMLISELRHDAEVCHRQHGVLGVSVAAADVPTLKDLMGLVNRYVAKLTVVSHCRRRDLRELELLPTGRAPHFTLVLPTLDEAALLDLCGVFTTVANPVLDGEPTH